MELARRQEQSIAKIASGLGIAESCLRNWMAQPDRDEGLRTGRKRVERLMRAARL